MAWGAALLLARYFARRGWAALVVAALTLALGGAFALAFLAGAERTQTAAVRAFDQARTADVSLDIAGLDRQRLAAVRSLPGVRDVSAFGYTPLRPVGSGMVPGIDVVGVMPLDRHSTRTMDRPRLISGRMPDASRFDEVLINPVIAQRMGVGVGDTFALESYAQREMLAVFESAEPPPPTGARAEVTVTGIGRDLSEIPDQDGGTFGVILLSPAWFERFGQPFDNVEHYDGQAAVFRILLRARVGDGEKDADRFVSEVFEIYEEDASSVFAEARSDVFGSAETTLRVEAFALALCGVVAAVATAVAVGQGLSRQQFVAAVPMVEVARAVGLTRADRVLSLLLPSVAALAVGLVLAVAGAAASSSLFPRGLGRRFEPAPGVRIDAVPVVGGAALLGLAIAAACILGAVRSSRGADARSAALPRLRIPLGRPHIGVGVRMALHAGRGATRVPARQTVVGAITGIAGVVAALTFAASLDRLVATPRLFGEDYDTVVVLQGASAEDADTVAATLLEDRRIVGLARYGLAEVHVGGSATGVQFVESLEGAPTVAALSGRTPVSPDEVAVDPTQIPGPGPALGQVIEVTGSQAPVEFKVVGHLVGGGDALVMSDRSAAVLGVGIDEPGFHVRWAAGVDHAAAQRGLEERFAEVYPVSPSAAVSNLEQVRGFPYAVAALLAALAAAAVVHLLASGVRRRRRELAVLKALGFGRRDTRATVRWQAVTVTTVAVVAGSVLGVALGRGAWGLVASGVRVAFAPAVPVAGVLVVAALAFVVTIAVAAVPARAAARTSPAVALRAE